MGRDGVLSRELSFVNWLSIDDSVFDRASIRFASFLEDGDGECVGVTAAKIWDKSLASFGGWDGEAVGVERGDGESVLGFDFLGVPYVIRTVGLRSCDASTFASGVRERCSGCSVPTFCRFFEESS